MAVLTKRLKTNQCPSVLRYPSPRVAIVLVFSFTTCFRVVTLSIYLSEKAETRNNVTTREVWGMEFEPNIKSSEIRRETKRSFGESIVWNK